MWKRCGGRRSSRMIGVSPSPSGLAPGSAAALARGLGRSARGSGLASGGVTVASGATEVVSGTLVATTPCFFGADPAWARIADGIVEKVFEQFRQRVRTGANADNAASTQH